MILIVTPKQYRISFMVDTGVGRDSYSNSLLKFGRIDFYDVFFLACPVIPVSRGRHCFDSVSKHVLAAQIRCSPSSTAVQGLLIGTADPSDLPFGSHPEDARGVVKVPPSMGEGKSIWKNMARSPKGFLSHHNILHWVLVAFLPRLSQELLLCRAGFPDAVL